jgi:hypothetical protein
VFYLQTILASGINGQFGAVQKIVLRRIDSTLSTHPAALSTRTPLLLLHRLFHADGVGHQLQVAQNLWLFWLSM